MIPFGSRLGLIAVFAVTCMAVGFAAAPTALTESNEPDSNLSIGEINAPPVSPPVPGVRSPATRLRSGNPLWAIPLKNLSVTRERPIFSASRRPPAPAVAAAPYVPPRAPSKPPEPERPQLTLVGTIAGQQEAFGIFLDQTTNDVVRLKLGDAQRGWLLRRVLKREVMLEKDRETVVLALPAPTEGLAAAVPQVAGESAERESR